MAKAKKKEQKVEGIQIPSSLVKWVWIAAMAGLLIFMALLVLVSYTKMPDSQELENPRFEYASYVYSDDMELMGKYYRYNRDWVTYDELNPHLVNALVATEDERFYSHNGIDLKGTIRAMVFLGKRGGASTISQQLAKLFFTNRSSNFVKRVWQKMKEWVIAVEFEKRYTKNEIIAMYLNKFEYNYGAHGVEAAAQTYFGKKQSKLDLEEAAVLIGMLKNPSLYNPKRFPERAQSRRNVVLSQMRKNGYITKEEYNQLKTIALDNSKFKRQETYDGLAPYFRAELTNQLRDLLENEKITKPDGTKYNLYIDGLKIYTTLDSRMQAHAEKAMFKHMKSLQERYFNRWEGMDPWKYDADDSQLKIRRESLNRMVRESDRYRTIRKKYLSEIITQIGKEVEGSKWRDIDIQRMLRQSKNDTHFKQLIRDKVITKKQAKVYEQIMAREDYKTLRKQWNALQSKAKKVFNTKRTMQVFAYNDKGYKVVNMTPMDSIKYHRMHMQLGSVSIEPQTGFVKTWVGGIDYDYFKFDHVNDKNRRQIGSTFKPFVYATAISNLAFSPCYRVEDKQYTIPANDPDFRLSKAYSPKNSKDFTNQMVTLKDGMKNSMNSVSLFLMMQLGNVSIVKDLTTNMGIPSSKIPDYPSICLGAADLSVIEMAGAYTTFANNGVYSKPIFIKEIRDKNGKLIYKAVPEQKKAIAPHYNYAMVNMLQHATNHLSGQLNTSFGGKTGTTNDHRDGWFMGITPNLVVGTWVGGEDQWIRFRSIGDGQGGVMARPFFFDFMQRVERDRALGFDTSAEFVVPDGEGIELDCSAYAELIEQEVEDEPDLEEFSRDDEFDEDF